MPSKSLFRQPGAKHFQLVHRSQRDPLINDPEASTHVLKPFERENAKKGKSRADLEEILSPEDTADPSRRIGEASLYGVYFDDTEYDYMQHLRPVGLQEDGVESILIEAPVIPRHKKGRSTPKASFEIADLPEGVLASSSELPRTYESQQAIPESIAGFQPDMDAHLRQVLEALEDDAFIENDLEDDFFHQLVADGERGSDEEFKSEFTDEGYEEESPNIGDSADEGCLDWEKRFSAFKKAQVKENSDDEYASEGGDTIGTLHTISVIGGKKRRKGKSDASGYSMSSSSMYRNEALQTLDERFDQMILKHYNDEEHCDIPHDDDNDEAPQLITSREDFDSMVNEFLNDFEIIGRKMKPKLEGENGKDKLEILRRAMGQDERVRIVDAQDDEDNDPDDPFSSDDEDKKDAWDCETILTTYTNLENHPRLIRARVSQSAPHIILNRKTGLPSISDSHQTIQKTTNPATKYSDSDDSDDTEGDSNARQTITRPQNESKEEKKKRKASVKEERRVRRVKKKSLKEQFGAETKDQMKRIGNKELRLKKL